jgi:plastocyanin
MAVRPLAGLFCALVVAVAACSAATPASKLPIPTGALELKATNTAFAPSRLTVPAGQAFEVYLDNADSMPHNVVIIAADGRRVVVGEIFTGPAQRLLRVPALAPGVYQVRCDIHSEMLGELKAVAGSAKAPTQ